MKQRIIILCPYFNDNNSLKHLLDVFQQLYAHSSHDLSFFIIDDGSTEQAKVHNTYSFEINILPLKRNLGHQKAITIGLSYLKEHIGFDKVVIMDCDGEDRPEDAYRLIEASTNQPGHIIFGKRTSRQEGNRFLFFYFLYRWLFKFLTGKKISFGHFLIMPATSVEKIVYYNEIWNHIPGGIIKSGLRYTSIETNRGKRYSGHSKMNFNSLLLHGLGAIAVFIETVSVRLLVLSIATMALSSLSIVGIFVIKTFTQLAIPGWASTLASLLFVVLLQGFLLSLFTVFLYLSSQLQKKIIPIYDYKDYTGDIYKLSK